MHHSLKLYNRHRGIFLRAYIFFGGWTRIPVIGRFVRRIANIYGNRMSAAYLLTLDEAQAIMDSAKKLALSPCTCRSLFKNCHSPVNVEIMVSLNDHGFAEGHLHEYKNITKQEAKDILQDCHQRGLIHTIVKCREDFYSICNCCRCCCVPLRLSKNYGIGRALTRDKTIVEQFKASLEC
jgi:hypothetical protein